MATVDFHRCIIRDAQRMMRERHRLRDSETSRSQFGKWVKEHRHSEKPYHKSYRITSPRAQVLNPKPQTLPQILQKHLASCPSGTSDQHQRLSQQTLNPQCAPGLPPPLLHQHQRLRCRPPFHLDVPVAHVRKVLLRKVSDRLRA